MSDFGALLAPRRIAVVGASRRAGGPSSALLDAFTQWEYPGDIVLVNASGESIGDRRTFRRVADIADPIDVAFVLVPAAATVDALEQCAAIGVRLAVVGSAGFAEDRDPAGVARQDEVRALAQRTGMRVIGPNSQGFLSVQARVPATFSPSVWSTSLAAVGASSYPLGNVALLAQSGGLGFSLFNRGAARGIGFSHVVSTGNEADIDVQDLLAWLIEDSYTQVVGIYLEGLQDPNRFVPLLERARDTNTRLVIAKVGRSVAGQRAALGHTGHLAGDDEAYDALFRRHGVVRVHDPDELLDAVAALSSCRMLPASRGVGIVSASGGSAVWMADAVTSVGLDVPVLAPETQARVAEVLPTFATVDNPVDITGAATVGAAEVLERIAADPSIGALVLATTIARVARVEADRPALERIVTNIGKPVLVYSYTEPAAESRAVLRNIGLPVYTSILGTARAAAALVRAATVAPEAVEPSERARAAIALLYNGGAGARSEYEVKAALRVMQLPLPDGALARDGAEAAAVAERLGAPVALKVQAREIAHKARVGGVRLGVTAATAAAIADEMLREVALRAPDAQIEGLLVEAMAQAGTEVLIGVENGSGFGPMIVVGWGGSLVEAIGRSAVFPAPLTTNNASDVIADVGLDLALGAAGTQTLSSIVAAVSQLAWAGRDTLAELELNPVIVTPGGEATIADAFAVVKGTGS